MDPRTILYTGKGGVGKTSVAAGTALALARGGLRTVVMSTDPAHSLSDSLETQLGSQPVQVDDNLWGQEVQAQIEMERHWSAVQKWLGGILAEQGVDGIAAEELTVPPGADELFSLLQIKRHWESGAFDAVVVDCAPTGETLRLLSFPDVARWWLQKVFPRDRRALGLALPVARAIFNVDLPGEDVFAEVRGLIENLVEMNGILRNRERTTIRLVMNPEQMVIREAQRTFTYLNLYGYLTDAVIVNRVFPEDADSYFSAWRSSQQDRLKQVKASFHPVPVLTAPYFEQEVLGEGMLTRLADHVFARHDAGAILHSELSQELVAHNGHARLKVSLPFATKGEIDLKKAGPELVVRVADQKRTIVLPAAMTSYQPRSATFAEGELEILFESAKQ